MKWVSFDCYGTLVDWNAGFLNILGPLFASETGSVLQAYHEAEREVETAVPHRPYKDVLALALTNAAKRVGFSLSEPKARSLERLWGTLPVFADVEAMLAGLRASGYRLAVLTNCDEDLFAQTQRSFQQPFDLVITAERVRSYKPKLGHFESFLQASGVTREDWVHVACSVFHDIAPAQAFGVSCVWLGRDGTGQGRQPACLRVRSASEVCRAVQEP